MKAKGTFFLEKEKLETREFDLPELTDDTVLLKNKACGVCGTDVHIYFGEKGASDVNPPVILGHEYSAEVVEIGKNVTNVSVGDHVTIDPNIYCGICPYCRNGRKQMCTDMQAIGVNFNGGFATYSVVPAKQCVPVNPELSFEAAAMTEPLACCIHGIDLAGIRVGMTVCVIGGGPIGQFMIQLSRLSGASCVILSEPVKMRRDLGLSLGADYAIDPAGAPIEEQVQSLNGKGADVVIECVGSGRATEQAFAAADKGATIVLFSVSSPDRTYELNLFNAFRKELTIKTSFVNPDTHLRAVSLLNSGRIQTAPLITHRYGIEELGEAIKKQTEKDSVKVLVIPD